MVSTFKHVSIFHCQNQQSQVKQKNDGLMRLHAAVRGLKILFAQTKPQIKKTQKTLFALEADMSAQKTHN